MLDRVAPGEVDVLRALAQRIDQHDPRAFNNLGVLYHSKGMFADAVDALLQAVTLDPRMQTALRNLEIVAAHEGACDSRLAELATRLAKNADDREAGREQARLFRLIGRHAEAMHKLDALIAEDPDDAEALLERGLLEQRAGDLRRSQRWFERAAAAARNEAMPRYHLAEVLYQRGQNEQALATLDALLEFDDTIADVHLLRGFVLGDMGRHEAGMESARRASALNPAVQSAQPNLSLEKLTPRSVQAVALTAMPSVPMAGVVTGGELARYGLGLAFRQRGYFVEARREFDRALASGEDQRVVRHAIAELDLISGRPTEACAAYQWLIDTYGEQPRWRNEMGVAQHQGGFVEAAAENYRLALGQHPELALAYNNLGVALDDLGNTAGAGEALQQAVALNPGLTRSRLNLARWLTKKGDALSALGLLRELVAFHERSPDVWCELGRTLIALGRTSDAKDALVRAISFRAECAAARYLLSDILRAEGDLKGALREQELAHPVARRSQSNRLSLGIELQEECPEAVGALTLLPTVLDIANAERACAEAETCASRSQHEEALLGYREVRVALNSGAAETLWRKAAIGEARSLCLLGIGASALPLLEQILNSNEEGASDSAEVLALIAAAHAAAGKPNGVTAPLARRAIERFLRLDSRSAALLHFVGNVALKINDDGLAMILFRRALAVDPTRLSPRVAIARMLRHRKDMLAARLELVAALSVAPTLREGLLEFAHLHCDTGRAQDAIAILSTHLGRVSDDADALTLLADALQLAGRTRDARLALKRALRHDRNHARALELQAALNTGTLADSPLTSVAA